MTSYDKDVVVVSNPKCDLPNEVLSAMNTRRDAHIAELRERAAKMHQLRPTSEERQVRQKLRSGLLALTDLREEDAERIDRESKILVGQIGDDIRPPNKLSHFPPLDPAPIAGEGELWWAQTYVTRSNMGGLITFFQDDGLHIVGTRESGSGDLQKGNVTVVAQFGLGMDRMPSSNAVQFISNPVAELYGQVRGYTSFLPLYFGDHWAKCWLNTSQTIYSGIPLPFHIPSASGSETRTLVFVESGADFQWTNLPGFFAMPPIAFLLPDRTHPIQVDLEFSFDLQLEGEADIQIGVPSANESAVLRTRQWKLVPV